MTVRTVRQILNAATALCGVGIACVVVWAMTEPSLPESEKPRLQRLTATNATTDGSVVSARQLQVVAQRRLQGPLKDPAPPQKTARPKPSGRPAPPFNPRVELLATVIDSANTIAIIADARGRTDLKGVGETLQLMPSGLKVEEIQPGQVTLSLRGRSIDLKLKGGTGSPSRGPGGRSGNRAGGSRNPRGKKTTEAEHIEQGLGPDMSNESMGPQGTPPRGMMGP